MPSVHPPNQSNPTGVSYRNVPRCVPTLASSVPCKLCRAKQETPCYIQLTTTATTHARTPDSPRCGRDTLASLPACHQFIMHQHMYVSIALHSAKLKKRRRRRSSGGHDRPGGTGRAHSEGCAPPPPVGRPALVMPSSIHPRLALPCHAFDAWPHPVAEGHGRWAG